MAGAGLDREIGRVEVWEQRGRSRSWEPMK